ncbi:threonylcarbamoyl-AMP synthase [Leptospira wolffii]|uniref:L-threonylcarbamoyladenylate synthase n=1 Tax=Leptospira wolffii TaxID=409998 RepID=UPI0010831920|nr:L-threonylcarbamoyladenylate synthase [Leptospira wolffii]TGL53828.1 threonylcarbamoyl-AMP synthase [Leptospira wolffii]
MSKNKNTILTKDPSLAAKALEKGGIVLFPTETVYGIGADSRNFDACLEIYKIKNRPADNPLIVHLADPNDIQKIAELPKNAEILLEKYMPGPLTLVLPKKDSKVFSAGLDTIAVRVPSHSLAREMIRLSGVPVSAPSANLSGRPSITRLEDAIHEFQGKVDVILDGQEPEIGLESTVIDLSGNSPKILRPGFLGPEELKEIFPNLSYTSYYPNEEEGIRPASPGMKYRHYAPDANVIFAEIGTLPKEDSAAIGIDLLEGWAFSLSVPDNLEYMKNLYSFFRDCDRMRIRTVYCFPPAEGQGKEALLNRIRKAQDR